MSLSFFNNLAVANKIRQIFRHVLFLPCVVLLLTHLSPAQDSKPSKIPDGEAQFTSTGLGTSYNVTLNVSDNGAGESQPVSMTAKD